MEADRIKQALASHASEYLDGHIIIGFSTTGELVMSTNAGDPKTAIALNARLIDLVASGGVAAESSKHVEKTKRRGS